MRNTGLKLVPVFHESTHIGDEFSIHGYQNLPAFRRVNVSYEAWEIAAVINDPDTIKSNLFGQGGCPRLMEPCQRVFFALNVG